MKNKKHTYIQYKALGEVQIAKGMVLIPAFSDGGDLKYYYVAKDEKTGGYYITKDLKKLLKFQVQ